MMKELKGVKKCYGESDGLYWNLLLTLFLQTSCFPLPCPIVDKHFSILLIYVIRNKDFILYFETRTLFDDRSLLASSHYGGNDDDNDDACAAASRRVLCAWKYTLACASRIGSHKSSFFGYPPPIHITNGTFNR